MGLAFCLIFSSLRFSLHLSLSLCLSAAISFTDFYVEKSIFGRQVIEEHFAFFVSMSSTFQHDADIVAALFLSIQMFAQVGFFPLVANLPPHSHTFSMFLVMHAP